MHIDLVRRPAGADCESILAELPQWFGIPRSNAAYAELAEREGAFVAEQSGSAVGLMVLQDHGFSAIDIHLLAVRRGNHRQGVGRSLVRCACEAAQDLLRRYVSVKTQGPSSGYEPYTRTRAFYLALGFDPIEEFADIWGPENPCLLMVKPIASGLR